MLFYNQSDTSKSIISADSTIVFYIKTGADAYLKDLAVYFKLTAGATIKPANGSTQDFSQGPVRYRVTSEDGMWHRDYLVEFKPIQPITTDIKFEDFELDASQKYYTWFERNAPRSPTRYTPNHYKSRCASGRAELPPDSIALCNCAPPASLPGTTYPPPSWHRSKSAW